jgi:formamidopyrimidine-DNA glycosylase
VRELSWIGVKFLPELPEVESVRRGLEAHLVGRRFVSIAVQNPKILRPPTPTPELFAENIVNCLVKSVNRRGKHLILSMDNGYSLAAHLKMRGQMRVALPAEFDTDRFLCASIGLDDGREWRFYDMWAWGELRVYPGGFENAGGYITAVSEMGPEPLSESFSPNVLIRAGQTSPNRPVKAILLDQGVLAGVGNIYADESLHCAGIHPVRPGGELSEREWRWLHDQVREVIGAALEMGGTVSDNFVDSNGRPGRYVPLVYGRAGKKCNRCGTILQRIKVSGRGTVFCGQCQPVSSK